MRWFWKKAHEPSGEALEQARQETEEARKRLRAVERDDERVKQITARAQQKIEENDFAASFRRALGGTG